VRRQLIARARIETISVQEEGKKDQEHKDLYSFTLPQGLHPVLCQLANSFTKNEHQDQFYTIHNTCDQQATIAHNNKQPTAPYNSCSTNTREMSRPLLHGIVPQSSFRWG